MTRGNRGKAYCLDCRKWYRLNAAGRFPRHHVGKDWPRVCPGRIGERR